MRHARLPCLSLIVIAVMLPGLVRAQEMLVPPPGSVYHVTTDEAGENFIMLVPAIHHPPASATPQTEQRFSEVKKSEVKQTTYTTPALKVVLPPPARPVVMETRQFLPGYQATKQTAAPVPAPPPPPSSGRLGHAPDYRWLVGEISYSVARRTWNLRYATVDEEDRYGGSVTLVGTGDMSRFKIGQIVRIDGYLVEPDSRRPCPPYCVGTIREVD